MGNRKKPVKLKMLLGNPGKQTLARQKEPEVPDGDLMMPEWLNAFPEAVKEWERDSVILKHMGLLTIADAGTFATRCYLSAQIQEAAATLETVPKADRQYTQIKLLITEYRQVGSLLGLDPSSRARLSVDPLEKPKSKFEGLIGGKAKK